MIYDEPIVFNAEAQFNVLPKRLIDSFQKLTTNPDVSNVEVFRTLNTTGTTVTSFLKGASGQSINIKGDGFTTIENNASIKTSTGTAKLLSANLIYRFTNIDNVWYEDASDAGGGGTGGAAGGADRQIQFNDTGALGGADSLQFFSKQIVAFGPLTSTLLTSLLLPAYAGTSLIITADPARHGGTNDASIYLTNSASGGWREMSSQIVATGDQGLRLHYNLIQDAAGFHHSDSFTPGLQLSFETDGAMGLEYTKPPVVAAGAYDSLPGKSFKWHPAGFPAATGQKTKYPMFTTGEPGCGMDIGVEIGGTGSNFGARIRIDDSSNANPVYLYVNGSLHQVTIDGSGFLKG